MRLVSALSSSPSRGNYNTVSCSSSLVIEPAKMRRRNYCRGDNIQVWGRGLSSRCWLPVPSSCSVLSPYLLNSLSPSHDLLYAVSSSFLILSVCRDDSNKVWNRGCVWGWSQSVARCHPEQPWRPGQMQRCLTEMRPKRRRTGEGLEVPELQ